VETDTPFHQREVEEEVSDGVEAAVYVVFDSFLDETWVASI